MANLQTVASVVAAFAANDREKQLRSVFVGNIPYEATEEQLKEIFSEVGPVVTFRLVFDRETGKPKGYGFCEYKDQETALSAMRNLNAYELNGRTLRVDNAASERSKEELRNLQEQENMNRQPQIEPERAPEAISKAVASLPPEQMFELMKQMQLCIQNNPVQAKEILLQNAQLAYALLQAQVVMRIIPPESALSMLQKPNKSVGIAPQLEKNVAQASSIIANQPMNPPNMGAGPANNIQRPGLLNNPLPQNVPVMQNNAIFPIPNAPSGILDTFDQRNSMGDRDMRIPPASRDPRAMQIDNKFDPRLRSGDVQNKASVANPYNNRMQNQTGLNQGVNQGGFMNSDPRNNPLAALGRGGIGGPSRPVNPMGINQQRPASAIPSPMITSQDQEKAALIMQVLQLSPEQIASLPEEQKQSIMVLKDQIARSQQH